MSKLPETLAIEKILSSRFQGTAYRYATEVSVSYISGAAIKSGIVDFVTAKRDFNFGGIHRITCYEIKVSYKDMLSEHGHTLVGDENYYVLTKPLYEEIMQKNPNFLMGDMGIMIYAEGSLRTIRKSNKRLGSDLTIEGRFGVLDNILSRWQNGRQGLPGETSGETGE